MIGLERINEDLLSEIIRHNGEAIVFSLESKKESINRIINYLESIGIKNIDELLKYEIDLFLRDLSSVKKMIQPDDIDLINSINDDCACVEDI